MTDLKRLRELAMAATPGPWSYCPDEQELHSDSMQQSDGDPAHIVYKFGVREQDAGKNMAFIAAANPQTLLSLIDRIERLEGALRDAHEMLSHAVAIGYFNPGGSTEAWAKRVLESLPDRGALGDD